MWMQTFRGKIVNLDHAVQIYISDVINKATCEPERWDVMASFSVTESEYGVDFEQVFDYPMTAVLWQFKSKEEAQSFIDKILEKIGG